MDVPFAARSSSRGLHGHPISGRALAGRLAAARSPHPRRRARAGAAVRPATPGAGSCRMTRRPRCVRNDGGRADPPGPVGARGAVVVVWGAGGSRPHIQKSTPAGRSCVVAVDFVFRGGRSSTAGRNR